jgi:hypothetical protein
VPTQIQKEVTASILLLRMKRGIQKLFQRVRNAWVFSLWNASAHCALVFQLSAWVCLWNVCHHEDNAEGIWSNLEYCWLNSTGFVNWYPRATSWTTDKFSL